MTDKEFQKKLLSRIKYSTLLYAPKCPAATAIMHAATQAHSAVGLTLYTYGYVGKLAEDNKLPSELYKAISTLEWIAAELDRLVEYHESCRLAEHEYYHEEYKPKNATGLNSNEGQKQA